MPSKTWQLYLITEVKYKITKKMPYVWLFKKTGLVQLSVALWVNFTFKGVCLLVAYVIPTNNGDDIVTIIYHHMSIMALPQYLV
jgi:hypothetical protein